MNDAADWPWPRDAAAAAAPDDMAQCFARCFQGIDGEKALAHLRALTIDRRCPPDIGQAELRHLEGQRFAVAYIAALVSRGRS